MRPIAQVDVTEYVKETGEEPKGYGDWVFVTEDGGLVECDGEMYGEAKAQLDESKSWTLMPPPISKKK